MSENIEERINLQKAVFEIEDANLFNRYELKQLEDFLNSGKPGLAAHSMSPATKPSSKSVLPVLFRPSL